MNFARALGETLGAARRTRGLTLKDVERLSRGRFKASAVGGYERGERSVSLERFSALASVYGVPPDRLLADVMATALTGPRVVLDVNRLSAVDPGIGRKVGEMIHRIRSQREEYLTDLVAVRSGDLVSVAFDLDMRPADLTRKLKPVIVREASLGSGRKLTAHRSG